jgi:RNA polymerase sigma-70 factor, ECF subfamily
MGPGSAAAREAEWRDRAAAEAALMARVAAGEREAALIELYERYATPVFRFAIQWTGDRQQAEDIVQETFLRLWRSAGRFDAGRSSVRAFVFLLARRAAIDVHRRASVRPALEPVADEPADHSTEEAAERIVTAITVREALEALGPKHRHVLELGFDRDLTQADIARRLDLPLGTVKSRTYHALRALKDELERRGVDV